ncbi:2-oxoacid:acceptor oxidoreductase subunit alpha [Telmatospirillum siberiense]|uniref:2-oxoglutarate synthase n=1 Tax=Telmatospirillum siberiense TaxID=382514 RepID=A0A2N3Q1B2_9PROT|nr:2-oxoacid:acceptor oxidoreductase subunit alpha [Telmatospirillum siberiense]PKU26445.1 2-oxoglutarate synthase [Telmatospirillum siberiense]
MSYSISVALTGSGGAGAMTAGQILLDSAAQAGFYGLMTRSMGPQIRGGEAAALVRISSVPISSLDDHYDLLVPFDWGNINRFSAELPLSSSSLILADPEQGDVPPSIAGYGARVAALPLKALAGAIPGGRANMVGLGAVATLIGLPIASVIAVLTKQLARKGEEVLAASTACLEAGAQAAAGLPSVTKLPSQPHGEALRWNISGNEAAGLGALRGGIKFVAAYPITPATEVLEWLAPALEKTGGALVQAEDELASINMVIGGSFAGLPSLTATSGPGLSLMTESIGLAVASETPLVVIDVMRGGPSTGIPTKSEQSDLNIAVYGLHGDAPHVVVAPNSATDCLFATQWSVHLAEALQTPAIVLSDQAMGQSRVVIDKPAENGFVAQRLVPEADAPGYQRYALTNSGVSPMAIPGMAGNNYVADGLEHNERGTPSSQASDHLAQLDKRAGKLDAFDYGEHWADIEGDGEIAVITWGSVTGPVREAIGRARAKGIKAKMISLRLILPTRPAQMQEALKGVKKVLVVEQSHSQQFHKFLRGHYDLPGDVLVVSRPGPLPIRPAEIETRLAAWK